MTRPRESYTPELVIARAAGVSAWQFIGPAIIIAFVIGAATTTLYNPISASLREESALVW